MSLMFLVSIMSNLTKAQLMNEYFLKRKSHAGCARENVGYYLMEIMFQTRGWGTFTLQRVI